jgi:leader peptidase (prepilin peptidase)/N-methyltransferase
MQTFLIEYQIFIYLFFLGISIGSFINNIAYRINNNMNTMTDLKSVLKADTPKYSECPICKNKLKWWMNIPIFSWVFLKGQCYFCNSKIPFLYVFSEFVFGFVYILIYFFNKNIIESSLLFFIYILSYLNISIYFIEKKNKINKILLYLLIIGIAISLFIFKYSI